VAVLFYNVVRVIVAKGLEAQVQKADSVGALNQSQLGKKVLCEMQGEHLVVGLGHQLERAY